LTVQEVLSKLKRKSARRKAAKKKPPKPLKIIPEEDVQFARRTIMGTEALSLDKPDKVFSNNQRRFVTYRWMVEFTFHHAPPDLLAKILYDTERVANRIGVSLGPDREEVARCLTEKHEECSGLYIKLVGGGTITCKCRCHHTAT
jgi:hypothetical protein